MGTVFVWNDEKVMQTDSGDAIHCEGTYYH